MFTFLVTFSLCFFHCYHKCCYHNYGCYYYHFLLLHKFKLNLLFALVYLAKYHFPSLYTHHFTNDLGTLFIAKLQVFILFFLCLGSLVQAASGFIGTIYNYFRSQLRFIFIDCYIFIHLIINDSISMIFFSFKLNVFFSC